MGKQKLLLLPGLDGTGLLFESLINALQDNIQIEIEVVRYPVNETRTYEELVDFVADIVRLHESIYIVAESFSGPIGLKILARHPDKIRGLVLAASFITPPSKFLLRLARLLPIEKLLKINIPDFLIRKFCLGNDSSNESISQFKTALRSVSPKVIAHRLDELLELDKNQFRGTDSNKVICLKASDDKLVSNHCTEELASVISVDVKEVQGPHFLLQTKVEECAKAIISVLTINNETV